MDGGDVNIVIGVGPTSTAKFHVCDILSQLRSNAGEDGVWEWGWGRLRIG